MGLVFGVEEIEPFIDNARKAGLDISDPLSGHGTDLAETTERSWQNMVWPEDAARGIFSFSIRYDDPDALKPAPVGRCWPVFGRRPCGCANLEYRRLKKSYGAQLGIRLALEQSRPD